MRCTLLETTRQAVNWEFGSTGRKGTPPTSVSIATSTATGHAVAKGPSMKRRLIALAPVALALLFVGAAARGGAQTATNAPLAVDTARIVITGTSNVHDYTAESTLVRLVAGKVASASGAPTSWDEVIRPGVLQAFEIALRADSLHSTRDGLDERMHDALKADQHPDITFRLSRLETSPTGATRAIGVLRLAGSERELTLDLTLTRRDAALVVTGQTRLLMTDFGIAAPRAMLGMLKTDPRVSVNFEAVLSLPTR
jgi:polyisoprenoid-binding protein YceI